MMVQFHATTICAVKRPDGDICIGGDGQVTMGETTIMKNGAKKVKKIFKGKVLTGFAGSVADAFSLTDKFENKLQEHDGNLKRAAVDLAQFWRSDKATRIIEPDKNVVAIGSGGNYAYSAASALFDNTELDAESIVRKSLEIASSICVYTNDNISVEKL